MNEYTVQKLADISGVSVRTLHYYDEIGLLKPSHIEERNGYRYYGENELLKLQQILFYRELDFTLQEIKAIITNSNFNTLTALESHKLQLNKEIKRIKGLLNTLDKTILKLKGETEMSDTEYFENLTKEEIEKHKAEARKEYGQFNDKTADWPVDKYKGVFADGQAIIKSLASKMEQGKKPEEESVQENIATYFIYINNFWECNYEAFGNLGKMYVDDVRFTKNIDKTKEGLSQYMCDAMQYYSKNHK